MSTVISVRQRVGEPQAQSASLDEETPEFYPVLFDPDREVSSSRESRQASASSDEMIGFQAVVDQFLAELQQRPYRMRPPIGCENS